MSAIAIGLLIIAHLADYSTFLVMIVRGGIGNELNPIVATIAEDHGLALLTVAKFAAVLLVATSFMIIGRTRPKVAAGVLTIGVLVGSFGALSNVLTF